jgi:hypothetical protein
MMDKVARPFHLIVGPTDKDMPMFDLMLSRAELQTLWKPLSEIQSKQESEK